MASLRGAALWIGAAVGYLVLEAVAAASFKPGYSYVHNFISDLGLSSGQLVHGRLVYFSRHYLMHAAFYLQGVAFFLGALLMVGIPDNRRARLFLGTVAANAVGNMVIGTVHSGEVHVVGAALAIVGGNTAILLGPAALGLVTDRRWYRGISTLLAAVGLSCLVMLMVLPDGFWERGSVYSIIAWQLLTATLLLTTRILATRRPRSDRCG